MFGWFGKKKKLREEEEERLEEEWHDKKDELMIGILGKEHDMVMHAIIPFEIGGALDLYYFPNQVDGTGVATKELTFACRDSSHNSKYSKYEIVMFTEHKLDLDDAKNEETPFGKAHRNISSVLNLIANYSTEAILEPYETCEFPEDMEDVGGKCLIFDSYEPNGKKSNDDGFGIMLVIEVFRDEMDFAREKGGKVLLNKLKKKGFYPYSDLNRISVI